MLKSIFAVLFLTSAIAQAKQVTLGSDLCRQEITKLIELELIYKDHKGREMRGFEARWDESAYLDKKQYISLLFASENVEYFYTEDSDVAGDVIRCDKLNGGKSSRILPKGFSHYPSCESINDAIRLEAAAGKVSYDYCKDHPQD